MFSVGKARAHVFSLATQLLGGHDGHTHHRHHHAHARQLSTSTSCLSPSHQPAPPLPTLSLEDVSLFRMHEFRLLFLARCCQLHALAGKAHVVLPAQAFETLTDILRVILREANNEDDFQSCRLVYALSAMVATYAGLHLQSAWAALRTHEAWSNPDLYRVTLEECVARDKQRWLGLQGPLQELLGLEGGSVVGQDVIRLLLLLRLRAIAEAVVQLRSEHEPLIQGLIDHCRELHGESFDLDEVYAAGATPPKLWLLDAAARLFDGAVNSHVDSSSPSPSVGFNVAEGPSGQCGTLRRGVSSSAIPNVLRWASEMAGGASTWACLGFSVHLSLLHHVIGQAAATSAISKDTLASHPPPPAAAGGPGLGAAAGSLDAGACLCGKPFYAEWRVLGGYHPEGERVRQLAPSLLCEPCFRSLFREQPLDDGKAISPPGAAAAPHPPQAVGCAPLPAAAEIRTPQSVVALAAAAAAASSVQPEVQPTSPLSTTTTVVVGLTDAEQAVPLPPQPQQPQQCQVQLPPSPSAQIQRPRSSSASGSTASSKSADARQPPRSSKDAGGFEGESSRASLIRRRSISGSSQKAATSIAPPPAPPRPNSTRERSSSSSSSSNPRLSVSGSGGGREGRGRLRKSELMAVLMSGELEVLKHVQARFAGFGMAATSHPRILFVDSSATDSAELRWCSKEEFAKRQRTGKKKGTMRGGLPLKHLLDVRRGEGASKDRSIVTLLFQERPLVVEAHTDERADLVEAVFRMVLNKNRKITLSK